MKKNYILFYLITIFSVYSGVFSMEESQPNWVFIKDMPGAVDKESSDVDWRIKNQKLELNLNASEIMTQHPFAELIKEAKDKNIPFILVKILSGDKGQFIHFVEGSVIKTLMSSWKMTDILTDPLNKEKIMNIELYIAGDDGKLRLLKDDVDTNYLEKFVTFEGRREEIEYPYRAYYLYKFIPVLTVPGLAQAFIADLYKNEFLLTMQRNKMHGRMIDLEQFAVKMNQIEKLQEEQENLSKQLTNLYQQKKNKTLSDTESKKLDNEIENIETKIDTISLQITSIEEFYDVESEKLLQLERLWLSWSLDKFGPKYALQKQRASDRMNEIEYKPHYLQD